MGGEFDTSRRLDSVARCASVGATRQIKGVPGRRCGLELDALRLDPGEAHAALRSQMRVEPRDLAGRLGSRGLLGLGGGRAERTELIQHPGLHVEVSTVRKYAIVDSRPGHESAQ